MTVEAQTSFPAAAGEADAEQKLHLLEARLAELGSLMVAYSGGVDSAFLAATAHRVLGSRMIAVLADSPSLARRDFEQACEFAREQEIPLHIIATEELEPARVSAQRRQSLLPLQGHALCRRWRRWARSWDSSALPMA